MEKEENTLFQTYGKLSLSHKVILLSVKDLEEKKILIEQVVKEDLSVRDLEQLKAEL